MTREREKQIQKSYLEMIKEQAEYLMAWNNDRAILKEVQEICQRMQELGGINYMDWTDNHKAAEELKKLHEEQDNK